MAIRFESATKRSPRGGPLYASLRDERKRRPRRSGQRLVARSPQNGGPRALGHVSVEVQEGEPFAIIGSNGAGKTSTLKHSSRASPTRAPGAYRCARVLAPSSRSAQASLRAYRPREHQARWPDRRDEQGRQPPPFSMRSLGFAETGHILDTAVKMYSSGMKARLCFPIGAYLGQSPRPRRARLLPQVPRSGVRDGLGCPATKVTGGTE